jgi:TatD DNase family protein
LLETDAPFMTPAPHRGKRNEPAYTVHIAEKLAEIKRLSIEDVAWQTTENVLQLFKLSAEA